MSPPRLLPALILILHGCMQGCGPGTTTASPASPGKGRESQAGLPAGKTRATLVEVSPGTLVTRVDAAQIEMIYSPEGPLSPGERLRGAIDASTIAFREEPIGTEPSGFHDLFGGTREPDPLLVVVDEGGVRFGKPYPADPALLTDLEALYAGIEKPEDLDAAFCTSLEALIARDPKMPALHERLAGCYQATGLTADAIEALEKEIEVNPSHSGAHLGLASAAAAAGDLDGARRHLVLALLYYPASDDARRWANGSGPIPSTRVRVESFEPDVSVTVDGAGFVVVRSVEDRPWTGAYALCKAGFRYAPEVRMAFGMKSGPYKPSLLEEMVCLRLAADAYGQGRAEGRSEEPMGEILLRASREELLIEAAFFEVLGFHDPDLMKFLPEDIGLLVIAWIEDSVLVAPDGPP